MSGVADADWHWGESGRHDGPMGSCRRDRACRVFALTGMDVLSDDVYERRELTGTDDAEGSHQD